MKWKKLGLVYCANQNSSWQWSHAYVPTPIQINNDTIRVFVSFLDKSKVGRIGFVDVSAESPLNVLNVSKEPSLDIGIDGTFDDNGVTPISLVREEGQLRLYYAGWQLGVKSRYYLFSGLAIAEGDFSKFTRYSQAPLLDRKNDELFVRSAPIVFKEAHIWKMWYISGNTWILDQGKLVPTYGLKYHESKDGLLWPNESRDVLTVDKNIEFGFGRPTIFKHANKYKMIFSSRRHEVGYRLGYAESQDGISWTRMDSKVGLDVSETGWDSEMVCFASVIFVKDKVYLFYNGNNYGETGFGVAELESWND